MEDMRRYGMDDYYRLAQECERLLALGHKP